MTSKKDLETIRGGKTNNVYTVWTRTEGQAFGTVGVLKSGNKDVAVTKTFPYGFTGPAREAARCLAEKL